MSKILIVYGSSTGNTENIARLITRGLSDAGVEPVPLMSPALAHGFFITSTTWDTNAGYHRGEQ